MIKHSHGLGVVFVGIAALVACGGGGSVSAPAGPEGGKAIVEELRTSSDKGGLIAKLKPSKADLEALFDASAVEAVSKYVEEMYAKIGDVGMKPEQTETLFFSATTEDFVGETEAARKFPGGYGRIAKKLKPGVTWYAWKYVKPGETLGMAFDGLAHVNGRWVWVPKPFRPIND